MCVCVCVCSEQESNRDLQRRANPSLTSLPPGRNLVHSRSLDAQPESAECVCVCYLWPGCLPALLALISCGILTALGMRCVCVCVCVCDRWRERGREVKLIVSRSSPPAAGENKEWKGFSLLS